MAEFKNQKLAFREHIPDNLLLEPIEYIFADHCRQADLCMALRNFTGDPDAQPTERELAVAILASLDRDLSLHIIDEETDLFPRLKARALREDHFADILQVLDQDHARDQELSRPVIAGLKRIVQGDAPKDSEGFRRATHTLAESHLRHLNWENAVVLALARKRLTAEDLSAMGRAMAARRAIPYPDE